MKNNISKLFIPLCLTVLLVVGCSEDFLELSPQQSVANEDALTTYGDFQSSITAAYNGLQGASYYGRYFVLVPDVMADDVKQHPSANRARLFSTYTALVGEPIALGLWAEGYQNINNLNAIINTDIEVPAARASDYNHIKGEAYALRGLIHFDLVRAFAQHYTFTPGATHLGVPIVTSFDKDSEPSRNTVAEVYAQVISDLQEGISRMNTSTRTGNTGTLSSHAAKALLARVYLYMDDMPMAESTANEVITTGPYSLVSNANYITEGWVNNFSSESIFEMSMTENDNNGSDALGGMYNNTGYGDYLPADDWVSLIPMDDVRRGWLDTDSDLTGDYAPYRLTKYPSNQGLNNTKVIRLSELYLIRAEARARQMKNTAQGDIDAIRQRAQPSAPNVTATGQALIDEAMLERRKELAFEGQRLWDMMRQKKPLVRTNCTSSICTISYPNDRVVWPIPEAELDANPNIESNPGY